VLGSLIGAALLASGRIGNVNSIHLAGTTSGKILGLASLLSLAYGALKAAQDPGRNGVFSSSLRRWRRWRWSIACLPRVTATTLSRGCC
jgi:hypothetical protein